MSESATKNNQTSDDNYDDFQFSYSKPYPGGLLMDEGGSKKAPP